MRPPARLVLIASSVLFLGWWFLSGSDRVAGDWQEVAKSDLLTTIDVEGTLQALRSQRLGPPPTPGFWEFKIASMAAEGEDVKKGDPVLGFDTSELERRLDSQRAVLESAEKEIEKKKTGILIRKRDDDLKLEEARANLEKARLKLERPDEFVAAIEIAELELDLELAEKEVAYLVRRGELLDEADEVELGILEEQRRLAATRATELTSSIERMTWKAPIDGTVIHVTDRRGEKKRVGDSVWRRERVLEIPDLSLMFAQGMVDEAAAGRIALGQGVEIRLDAYTDLTYAGRIAAIGKTVQPRTRNSPLRVVQVEIELDETDPGRMRPEMRFRGRIEVDRFEDVLVVPLAAIRYSEGGTTVERRSLAGREIVPVELGARSDEQVEVVSGLAEGDQIWVVGS